MPSQTFSCVESFSRRQGANQILRAKKSNQVAQATQYQPSSSNVSGKFTWQF
ncbi:MAG: hypothetical protein ACD_10C00580G0001 [uncultured bacterium]|nr:MAG: hypothetical protein ACD_10C00580G0001 [uncultured bacterium]